MRRHDRTVPALLIALATATAPLPGLAVPSGSSPQRLEACAREANARSLQGETRREYLRACLSGGGQPERTAACRETADTRQLSGPDWHRFMQDCLMRDAAPETAGK